ncbi:hypothetical protein predicted by Glimmer/Critica [Acetobacter ghanensis]|uniref:Uncharacterized protein n=1 Tax=Acetobacter ghanensis TaxID=431306 RepID=A0A0U5FBR6_9PROT|nr:hypothetical protein predicted by Glimmer/Critica [Acetobacter ghanensis]
MSVPAVRPACFFFWTLCLRGIIRHHLTPKSLN